MKYYLFDFDGTLVDSMPYYGAVMTGILDEYGIEYPEDIIKIITPLGFPGTARYFIGMGVKSTEEELLYKMTSRLSIEYETRIPAKESVEETLRALKSRGASLNILTASPHTSLDPCLKRCGIFEFFDNVWSCDDFSTTKADPEIYKMAAERIGCEVGELTFLDDNLGADKTAKAAGCTVIGVYDDSSRDCEADIRAATDGYIYKFSELL